MLSLGISRLLKECVINMLSDDTEKTIATQKSNRDSKPFEQIRRLIDSEIDQLLRHVAIQSLRFGLQIDF